MVGAIPGDRGQDSGEIRKTARRSPGSSPLSFLHGIADTLGKSVSPSFSNTRGRNWTHADACLAIDRNDFTPDSHWQLRLYSRAGSTFRRNSRPCASVPHNSNTANATIVTISNPASAHW